MHAGESLRILRAYAKVFLQTLHASAGILLRTQKHFLLVETTLTEAHSLWQNKKTFQRTLVVCKLKSMSRQNPSETAQLVAHQVQQATRSKRIKLSNALVVMKTNWSGHKRPS